MGQSILVVVDMQNDFITGSLGTREAQAIVGAVRSRIARAEREGWQVVFTRDTHSADYLDTREGQKLPVPHCLRYSSGWEIEPSLRIAGAPVFDKGTFGSVELARYLEEAGCTEIELVGVCTDICVISNALLIKAFLPQAAISVDGGCCAGTTPENHEQALRAMAQCQIEIR